jgi:hypothetical protein
MYTVLTLDEFGYPVGGVPVQLALLSGDGALPTAVTTGDHGVGQVFYTAGRKPGLVAVRAITDEDMAEVGVLQGPVSLASFPVSGTEAEVGLRAFWQGIVGELRVPR